MTLSKRSAYFMLFTLSFFINTALERFLSAASSSFSPAPTILVFAFVNLALGVLIFYKLSKPQNIIWWSAALCTVIGTMAYIMVVYCCIHAAETLRLAGTSLWLTYLLILLPPVILNIVIFFAIIHFSFKEKIFTFKVDKKYCIAFIAVILLSLIAALLYIVSATVSSSSDFPIKRFYNFQSSLISLIKLLRVAAIMVTAMFIDKCMVGDAKKVA